MTEFQRLRQIKLIIAAGDEIRPFAQTVQEEVEQAALARGCLPENARSLGAQAARAEADRRYAEIKLTWPIDLRNDLEP